MRFARQYFIQHIFFIVIFLYLLIYYSFIRTYFNYVLILFVIFFLYIHNFFLLFFFLYFNFLQSFFFFFFESCTIANVILYVTIYKECISSAPQEISLCIVCSSNDLFCSFFPSFLHQFHLPSRRHFIYFTCNRQNIMTSNPIGLFSTVVKKDRPIIEARNSLPCPLQTGKIPFTLQRKCVLGMTLCCI